MDDVLFHRWMDGDPVAATAVRNHVRTLAVRVLSHPAVRGGDHVGRASPLRDERARRELTGEIAREVLERGADDPQQLHASALLVAARRVLEIVREGRPSAPGESHAPPAVAVLLAVAPDALPPATRDAAEHHVEGCGQCKADAHLVQTIVRAQGVVDPEAELAELASEAAKVESKDLAAAMPAQTHSVAARVATRRAVRQRSAPVSARRSAVPALVAVLVLSVGGLYVLRNLLSRPSGARKAEIIALTDRSTPPVPPAGTLPADTEGALLDLENDDCRSGAKRLRTSRLSHPDDQPLLQLEAAAFVCAGDASAAAEALDRLEALPGADLPEVEWLRAQIALSRGDAATAIDALGAVIVARSDRAAAARTQLAAVRDVLY